MEKQVIGVIGLGPVGTILASYLAKSGVEIYGMDVAEWRVEQINKNGLHVEGYVTIETKMEKCFSDLEELSQVKDLTSLFVCTKTWAIKGVMNELVKHDWPKDMRILAFMNGIGPEDTVGEFVDKETISRGIVNLAGSLSPEGVASMNWFHPPNLVGPATERDPIWLEKIQKLFNEAGMNTVVTDHMSMKKAAFYKTILNSALNALCSVHGLTMAQALRLKHTLRNARMLLREGLSVAGMMGYHYGENALEQCLQYLQGGGDHYPSMWHDLKHKRPTEIDYINGKIVKIGRMFKNVNVDLNMFFTSAIVTQEIKNGTREKDDIPSYLINL